MSQFSFVWYIALISAKENLVCVCKFKTNMHAFCLGGASKMFFFIQALKKQTLNLQWEIQIQKETFNEYFIKVRILLQHEKFMCSLFYEYPVMCL